MASFLNQRLKGPASVTVAAHAAFWTLFIFFELLYLRDLTGRLEPVYTYIIYYGLNIGLFYSFLWLLNKSFTRPGAAFLKKPVIFSGILLVYLFLKYATNLLLVRAGLSSVSILPGLHLFLTGALYRGWTFGFFAVLYWVATHLSAYSRRAKDAEHGKLVLSLEMGKRLAEAENAYLRQQVNPHLLFNTLNFIYTQVYRQSAPAANVVDLLSGIMRFSLEPAGTDGKVLLQKELEQVGNLIEMNAARFDEPLQLKVAVDTGPGDFRIIPLILLTLTENLFKHAHLADPGNPAILEINVDKHNRLTYHSRNRKKAETNYRRTTSLGLHNARVRLDYAYSDTYTIDIRETTDTFELILTIPV